MSWKDIKTPYYIPEPKKEEEDIDWLKEVYKSTEHIKTEAPAPIYLNPITTIRLKDLKTIKLRGFTEIL